MLDKTNSLDAVHQWLNLTVAGTAWPGTDAIEDY